MRMPSRGPHPGTTRFKDPALRSQILKLRNDPDANAVMAGAFTKANATYLAQKLGREPSEGELYIAHFLGAGGAARLISQAASNPNATAATAFGNRGAGQSVDLLRSQDRRRANRCPGARCAHRAL